MNLSQLVGTSDGADEFFGDDVWKTNFLAIEERVYGRSVKTPDDGTVFSLIIENCHNYREQIKTPLKCIIKYRFPIITAILDN